MAVALGWPRDRVEVVDADQGRTGQTVEGRRGIQYILAELSLDHVGILLGQDASRLARYDPDWVPLVRSCGLFRALLGDYDGLYDPTDFNDRLLLGLKGIMSEAELHFLRLRMHEGRLNKARRGELFNHASIGYVHEPSGGLALDPDEQAQQVVRLVFDQFDRQGSLHGLLRYLVHHSLRLPVRPHYGPNRGKLEWRRPNRETLQNMLHHPLYAGYYRHGHRASTPVGRCLAGPGRGGQSTGRRIAWCCWRTAARPTSRRNASGPTRSGWRPTAPAPRRLERRARGPLFWLSITHIFSGALPLVNLGQFCDLANPHQDSFGNGAHDLTQYCLGPSSGFGG